MTSLHTLIARLRDPREQFTFQGGSSFAIDLAYKLSGETTFKPGDLVRRRGSKPGEPGYRPRTITRVLFSTDDGDWQTYTADQLEHVQLPHLKSANSATNIALYGCKLHGNRQCRTC